MKTSSIIFLILMGLSISINAKEVYVTDSIKFTLRKSEDNRSKILSMLTSGTRITVISENPATGYTRVRTKKGLEGYILTRHTLNKPISKWYLKKTQKELEELKQKHQLVNQELNQLKSGTSTERNKLSTELTDLQKTANNAVQFKIERDQLQKRVITVERELEQVKRDNQVLEDSGRQDWFLYGGLLSLFGVILGFLLPKLSWTRKHSSWDTF